MKPVAHPEAGKIDQYFAERQPVRPEHVPAGSPNAGSNVPDSLHDQPPFQRQDATLRRLIPSRSLHRGRSTPSHRTARSRACGS